MTRFYLSVSAGVGIFWLAHSSPAQSPAKREAPPRDAAIKEESNAKARAEQIAGERRAQARSLLVSLASDARSFRDQTLRARTLARIAEILWENDAERGRELFRKAWEAAVNADQDTERRRQEDIERQRIRSGGGFAIAAYPNVRGDVLRLAARRDRELGEEFLQNLKEDQRRDVNGEDLRLNLARQFLATGDSERAMQFASRELSTINLSTVDFLSRLREKDPSAADVRFAALIDVAARNVLSDANTVSLLSSYLFTPYEYITFQEGGMSHSVMGRSVPPSNVPSSLQQAFFQMAANVLLRPSPQQGQPVGLEGQYFIIKRLIPQFEQNASPELTQAVRARFDALGATVRESVRQRPDPTLRTSSESERAGREQALLDKIEHARTSPERDRLYFQLATLAAEKNDLRARDFVSKIEESEFRKQAQGYIDVTLATNSIRGKKTEIALELAHKGELTHIQRVWLLTQLAKLLVKTDPDRSLSLLETAVPEARRIGGSDPDRPRALLAIANALKLIEPSRARDALFDAVKAANVAEGFTGEDGNLNILFQAKGFSSASDLPEPDFDVEGIFGSLAQDDYDQTVELARGFQGEAPRAAAIIAIAQSVLNQKSAKVSKTSATKND